MIYCETVLDSSCTAAPEMGVATRAVCFACGLPSCRSCSKIIEWHGYGRRRVCAGCLEQNGYGPVVAQMLWTHAGYEGKPPRSVLAMFNNYHSKGQRS